MNNVQEYEALFDIFTILAREYEGIVCRGGIFTANHPRLKGRVGNRNIAIFFKKEGRFQTLLCIRIEDYFPFHLLVRPRSSLGSAALGQRFSNLREIDTDIPLFEIKADNLEKGEEYVAKPSFRYSLRELVSPSIMAERPAARQGSRDGENKTHRKLSTEYGQGLRAVNQELKDLTIPADRIFFLPVIELDRHGAFLRVRFDECIRSHIEEGCGVVWEIDASNRPLIKEIISSQVCSLERMLDSA